LQLTVTECEIVQTVYQAVCMRIYFTAVSSYIYCNI